MHIFIYLLASIINNTAGNFYMVSINAPYENVRLRMIGGCRINSGPNPHELLLSVA